MITMYTPSRKPKNAKKHSASRTGRCFTNLICSAMRVVVEMKTVATENL